MKYYIIAFFWLTSLIFVAHYFSNKEPQQIDRVVYRDKYIPKISSKSTYPSSIATINGKLEHVRHDTIIKLETKLDTLYIVQDYQTKFNYIDTLFKANQFRLILNDEVFQNRITARSWKFENLTPIYKEKWHLYLGAEISTFKSFSPSFGVLYVSRNKHALKANYDPLNKIYSFGYYQRLF